MTSLDSGTASNSLSGTKLVDTKALPMPEVMELWERNIHNLDPHTIRGRHPIEH
jgi:hypothetical protein